MSATADRARPKSLSNRRDFFPLSGIPPSDLGIDRLSLTFPVRDFSGNLADWASRSSRLRDLDEITTFSGSVPCSDSSVFVGVLHDPSRPSPVAKVEFNPSRLVDPSGWGLATLDQALEVAREAVEAAHELVRPEVGIDEFKVTRLDVARDFDYGKKPEAFLHALAGIDRTYATRNAVYYDGAREGAQTFIAGNKSGSVRVYDKHAEKAQAPAGTLRAEFELRKAWLRRYANVLCFSDLSADSIYGVSSNRWEWSKCGLRVVGRHGAVEVVEQSSLSSREKGTFLAWLLYGFRVSKNVETKYRRIQRELGIAYSEYVEPDSSVVEWLDWETGEVHREGVEDVSDLLGGRSVA